MSKFNNVMCPLFPDMVCPQGNKSADACKIRLEGDYNPLSDFKDYLIMNCAIQRAKEKENKSGMST